MRFLGKSENFQAIEGIAIGAEAMLLDQNTAGQARPLPGENFDQFRLSVSRHPGNSDDLPRSIRVQIKRVTSTGIADFTWPPPTEARGDLNYQVEVRRLSLESGKLEQFWIPVPNVTFTKKPECVTALVTGIPPGITRTVRIVASRAQGDACAASQSFQLSIPKPVSLFTVRNGLLAGFSLLLAGGLAALGREKWKARQGS